ncbi:uncharacterized protein OCT59_003587 [Rhizophagus irregularis]|nr:hypothetical protein OCT59_003587 [Rhizophagus irregularis]GBC37579.2 hypothetical protein RIR_jg29800.t1 [Rhizophagus irregularis DAOM 181602=DAOM 197198]
MSLILSPHLSVCYRKIIDWIRKWCNKDKRMPPNTLNEKIEFFPNLGISDDTTTSDKGTKLWDEMKPNITILADEMKPII